MIKAFDRINERNELQSPNNQHINFKGSIFLYPFKGLSGCFLVSMVFVSVLGVFFLYSPASISPTAKRALSPPPRRNAVIIRHQSDNCDLFKGHWVPDLRGPLYNNTSCLTIPDSKNCFMNGRKDTDFLNWRWNPDQCDLPKFDPFLFLNIVRGKKLAFVGDSVARNHMESLLCLLSQAETPLDVYKDPEDRFRTWNFPSSNFTLMILWTKFLVKHEERQINGSNLGAYNLHVDQIDESWATKLQSGIDYVVISDGHWLFRQNYIYNQSKLIGCVYCTDPNLQTMTLNDALRMVFRAALSYIDGCDECGDVLTLLRTFSPSHFENGSWDTGGDCTRTSPYSEKQGRSRGMYEMELRKVQIEELERVKREGRGKGKRFAGLDVTEAGLMRPDGHPGEFWGNKWMKGYNDCVHWCLPGPVDAWNDLLLAVLLREAPDQSSSFIIH